MDIFEDDKNVKRFKSNVGGVGKLFLGYLDYFKGTKHVDMTTGK